MSESKGASAPFVQLDLNEYRELLILKTRDQPEWAVGQILYYAQQNEGLREKLAQLNNEFYQLKERTREIDNES